MYQSSYVALLWECYLVYYIVIITFESHSYPGSGYYDYLCFSDRETGSEWYPWSPEQKSKSRALASKSMLFS